MTPLANFNPRSKVDLLLFVLLAFIAVLDDRNLRIMLIAPVAALFTLHTALYGLEYDEWMKIKREEKRLELLANAN